MLTLIFVILVVALITAIVIVSKKCLFDEIGIWMIFVIGILTCLIIFIFMFYGIIIISTQNVKRNKIEMYEQENQKMELVISDAIEKYLEQEKEIFIEISPEQTDIYLIAYPEIQSNELIKYQLNLLKDNREQIKELKDDLISVGTWKFLIYFGH